MDSQKKKRRKRGRTHLSTPRKQGRRGRSSVAEDAENLEEQAVVLETNNAECSGEPAIESPIDGASPLENTLSMGAAELQVSSGGAQSEPSGKEAPSNQESVQKEQGTDQQQQQQEQEKEKGESVQKLSLPPPPNAPQAEAPIAGLPGQQPHQRWKPLRPLEPAAPGMGAPQWPAHTFWMHGAPPYAPLQRPSDGHIQPRVQILQPNPSLPPVIIFPPPFMPPPPVHLGPGALAQPVSFSVDPQILSSWPPPKQQTVAAAHPELVKLLTCGCDRSGSERGATQSNAGEAAQSARKCTCDVYKFCRQAGALPVSEDVAAALAAFEHDNTTRGRKEEAVRYFLSQVMRQVLGFNVPFLHKLCALAEAANARSQCEATKGAGLSTRTESLCNLVTTCLPLKPATSAERALGTVLLPLDCVAASPFIFKLYKELNMSKGGPKKAPN